MTDTPSEIQSRYVEQLLALSPATRLEMASRMFSTAKALALAGLSPEEGASPASVRERLFRRLYGGDFSAQEVERIAEHLRAA